MMFGFFQRVAEMLVKRPESLLSERALKKYVLCPLPLPIFRIDYADECEYCSRVTETAFFLYLFHISNHAQMVMPRNATQSP